MITSKEEYLEILRLKLQNHVSLNEILIEYDHHISDMLLELTHTNITEKEAMMTIIHRLGTPEEMAHLYQEELTVTKTNTKWIFFLGNLFFFIGGIALTFIYHYVSVPSVTKIWYFLTSIPFYLIVLYLFFWLLLGYEVGKEFGLSGRKLLHKTFYLSLLPNLTLMMLVVFRIIPMAVFAPLLTQEFIYVCIIATVFLYPISFLGFRFGTTRSI